MFWGDIILNHPELIKTPEKLIALNWGYEATRPFEERDGDIREIQSPFLCLPRHGDLDDATATRTAFANLKFAAEAGRKHGAIGYLNTDWGGGGHPQPLAVSWPLYVIGAAHSWCSKVV